LVCQLAARKPWLKLSHEINDCSQPASVHISGMGWWRCHELKPLLRSSMVSSFVLRSFSIDGRSLIQLSLMVCTTGCRHCSMCTIVSVSCSQRGQVDVSLFPHQCMNLVIHRHCLIIIPVTTVCMAVQSIDSMSMPWNLNLFDQ